LRAASPGLRGAALTIAASNVTPWNSEGLAELTAAVIALVAAADPTASSIADCDHRELTIITTETDFGTCECFLISKL